MRSLIALILLSTPLLAMGEQTAERMAAEDAERACTRLIMDYAVYRDAGEARRYADLFTENGSLSLLGQTWQGRDAIYERMVNAEPQRSVHLMSTVRVYPESQTTARGVSYAEVYIEGETDSGPVETAGFMAIGRYIDRFERTPEGWKIAERRFERLLVRRPQ